MFCGLVIFIKNFDPINIRKPRAPKITMFCSEVMMIKIFNYIKSRRPWPPILTSYLFQQGLLVLGRTIFTPGVFWFRYPGLQDFMAACVRFLRDTGVWHFIMLRVGFYRSHKWFLTYCVSCECESKNVQVVS